MSTRNTSTTQMITWMKERIVSTPAG